MSHDSRLPCCVSRRGFLGGAATAAAAATLAPAPARAGSYTYAPDLRIDVHHHLFPTFEPVYEELNARNAVVLVHPTNPAYAPPNVGFSFPLPHFCFEWIAETARAMTNIIYRRVAKRYPNIRWIFMHGGGAMSAYTLRQAGLHAFLPDFNQVLPEGPMPYLRQFYWDTAQAYTPSPMASVKEVAPLSHILFGTDWPPIKNFYEHAQTQIPYPGEQLPDPAVGDPAPALSLSFSKPERRMIDGTNALELFPRLRAIYGAAGLRLGNEVR